MSIWGILAKNDSVEFADWFRKQTLTRIFIAFAYIFVLSAVGVGVYYWADSFFKYILPFESFGQLTAVYVLRGGLLMLIWVGILSSIITTVTFLLTPDRHTDLLLTFPFPTLVISLRAAIKSALFNLFLFLISIFPLVLAYTHQIWGPFVMLLLIVLFTDGMGLSLGYLFTFFLHKKHGWVTALIFTLLLMFATWLVLRIIFPPDLKTLANLPVEDFAAFFNNLPLIKDCWISKQFLNVAIGKYDGLLAIALVTLLLSAVSVLLQKYFFVPCWQSQKSRIFNQGSRETPLGRIKHVNLVVKDLLSVARNPRAIAYTLFLLTMIISFFGLFSRGYIARSIPERFRVEALAFSFGWLVFFSGTYLIRLAYPLIVNEGQSKWWFFTLPISASKLLNSKILVSLLISMPLVLLSVAEWVFLPFSLRPAFFSILSLVAILSLSLNFPLIGSVSPDFSLAYQPDRSSTSLTGLICIILSVLIGVLGSWLSIEALNGQIAMGIALNAFMGLVFFISAFNWLNAIRSLNKFSLEN